MGFGFLSGFRINLHRGADVLVSHDVLNDLQVGLIFTQSGAERVPQVMCRKVRQQNRFGQPQNPQTVNRAIKRISVAYNEAELEKAEKEKREPQLLPPFSCHNLRHTFCTRLCENETNLKIIQDIMGHRDISTTMEIYAEATKEAKAHSFANLNGKLGISV